MIGFLASVGRAADARHRIKVIVRWSGAADPEQRAGGSAGGPAALLPAARSFRSCGGLALVIILGWKQDSALRCMLNLARRSNYEKVTPAV